MTGRKATRSEAEWLATTDPQAMLQLLRSGIATKVRPASARKARLFACACCRRIWHLLEDERSREAVEAAEAFADGELDEEDRQTAHEVAVEAEDEARDQAEEEDSGGLDYPGAAPGAAVCAVAHEDDEDDPWLAAGTARGAVVYHARVNERVGEDAAEALGREEDAAQAELVREVFGNPFRPVRFEAAWRTKDVRQLAGVIYRDGEYDRLPILADALEEAGCAEERLLEHLRGPDAHVRGCWALDLVLGQE